MGTVTAAKAATLMGRAFRDRFDKVTFYALLKLSPDWEAHGEQMVRAHTEAYSGDTTFFVTLARRKGTSGIKSEDVVDANYMVRRALRATMDERAFEEIGHKMAEFVNAKVEELYMAIPDAD